MYSALLSLATSQLSRLAEIFQQKRFLEKTNWSVLDKVNEKSSSFDCMSALILIVPRTHSTWDAMLFVESVIELYRTRLGLQCRTPLRSYPWPLPLIPYSLSLIPHPSSLTPSPFSFSPSTVFLSRNLGEGCSCYCQTPV